MDDLFALSAQLDVTFKLLTSLAIGLLLGLQRERTPSAKAGLRTFALVALFGTISGLIADAVASAWIIAAGLVLVGLMIIAAYHHAEEGPEADSGTTTVIALMLCYGLGVMVWYERSQLAVAVGIVATALLQFKSELHGFSERLSRPDLASILQFAVLSFIVLPLLPNEGFGPYRVLNPYHIWLMVVLISGLSLSGYLALRLIGAKESLPLVGIFGGLVSSTATTLVYARQGKLLASLVPVAGGIIATANLIPLARLALIGAVVAPAALPALLPVLASGLAPGLVVLALRLRATMATPDLKVPELANPATLRIALGFGALYALALLGSAWLSEWGGRQGLYALALAGGCVNLDAITLSSLRLFDGGMATAPVSATAIGLAYVSSVALRMVVLIVLGGRPMLKYCGPAVLTPAAGVGAGILLFT
jgi:uncharacterized membrane protein (DUF4010 family)